jgi:hypothetical protein
MTKLSVKIVALAALLGATAWAPEARAQPAAEQPAPARTPEDLVKEAKVLANEGRWQEALPLFRQAYTMKKSYDVAGNLGITEHEVGQYRDAAQHLSEGLRGFPTSGKPEHRQLLEEKLVSSRRHLATLRLETNPQTACIDLNGRSIGCGPFATDVYEWPGTITVKSTLPGYAEWRQVIEAQSGSEHTVNVALVPVDSASPAPTDAPAPDAAAKPTWPLYAGIAVGSVGLAAVIVGGGLFGGSVKAASDAEEYRAAITEATGSADSGCANPTPNVADECAELSSLVSQEATLRDASIGMFVVGGVLVLGGGGLLIYHFVSEPPAEAALQPRLYPVVGQGTGGVVLEGRW